MSEQELFGLALGGTLILVIVVVILAVAIAAILKSREREVIVAASQRQRDEIVKNVEAFLIVKVWSDQPTPSKQHKKDVDLQALSLSCSPVVLNIPTADSVVGVQECEIDENSPESSIPRYEEVCAICLRPYRDNDLVGQSCNPHCQHEFHRDCIADWLVIRNECPCCRQTFLSDNS